MKGMNKTMAWVAAALLLACTTSCLEGGSNSVESTTVGIIRRESKEGKMVMDNPFPYDTDGTDSYAVSCHAKRIVAPHDGCDTTDHRGRTGKNANESGPTNGSTGCDASPRSHAARGTAPAY